MTAKDELHKQKVRAVWPNAYVDWFMTTHEYVIWSTDDPSEKILGRGAKKYAAWQNAAESLLPQHCSGCLYPDGHNGETHCYGTIEHPEPVEPITVEAKEKPNCICDHAENQHWPESRDNFKLRRCSDLGCHCEDYIPTGVAEPKPTPSTSHPEDCCGKCARPNCAWFTENDIWNLLGRSGVLCPVCFIEEAEAKGLDKSSWRIVPENYKPQPDSSSIPEIELELRKMMWLGHGHTWMYGDDGEMQCGECQSFGVVDYKREPLDKVRETFRAVQVERMMKPRDSFSISSEQTFKEWLIGYSSPPIGDLGFQYTTAVEMMRSAWNAAKRSEEK